MYRDLDWTNETVFILGGGPSVSKLIPDISVLKDRKVIAVNNGYKLAPFSDILIFADAAWYEWHRNDLPDFEGLKFCGAWGGNKGQYADDIIQLEKTGDSEIDMHKGFVRGKNTGYQAINLAMQLGAKNIVLLGFDMKFDDKGNANWHTDHKRTGRPGIYKEAMLPFFPSIQEYIDKNQLDVHIYNINKDSELDVFPYKSIEEFLA